MFEPQRWEQYADNTGDLVTKAAAMQMVQKEAFRLCSLRLQELEEALNHASEATLDFAAAIEKRKNALSLISLVQERMNYI